MNTIPVGKTITYAYSFTFGHLGTVIGLTWLPMLLVVGLNYIGVEAMRPASEIDPAMLRANPALAFQGIGYFLLTLIGAMFLQAVVAVAIVRQALGLRTGGALAHIAAGRDEWRMFAGYLRYFFSAIGIVIIVYIGMILIGLVGGMIMGGVAQQSPAAGSIVGVLILVAFVALLGAAIYALVRMGFLLSPSIVAEPRGGIQRSYDLTKGNFWRIVGVWAAVGLPLIVLVYVGQYVFFWHVFHLDFSNLPVDPTKAAQEVVRRFNEAMTAVNTEMMRQQIPLAIMNFLYGVFSAALGFSAASFAYRALVPAHESPSAA